MASRTAATYDSAFRQFERFCADHGRPSVKTLFPISVHALLGFATYLFGQRKLQPSSVASYLSGVRSVTLELGEDIGAFDSPRLEKLLRGIKKSAGGRPRRSRLPITVALLRRLLATLNLKDKMLLMLAAVMSVAVFGMFRSGELVWKDRHSNLLRRCDVLWFADRVEIHLRESKSDLFCVGVTVKVFKLAMEHAVICPYRLLRLAWDGATDQAPSAPLFQVPSGARLTYSRLFALVRSAVAAIGLSAGDYALHSFRIGGATSLAIMGVDSATICTLGRWKGLQSCKLYIRTSDTMLATAMANMSAHVCRGPISAGGASALFGGISPDAAAKLTFDDVGVAFQAR